MSRPLAPGELALARTVFGDAIRYGRVRVHARRYVFFQPRDVAMTPNGQIYFPRGVYRDDFSTDLANAGWLLHELTHVWQHQRGRWVRLLAPFSRRYAYGSLAGRPDYARLNIEQQAAVVEDYHRVRHGARPTNGTGTLADYRAVIPFLPAEA